MCSVAFSFLRLYPQSIWAAERKHAGIVSENKDKNVVEDTDSECGSGKLEFGISHITSEKNHASCNTKSESVPCMEDLPVGENSEKDMDVKQSTGDSTSHVTCVLGMDLVVTAPNSEGKPIFLSKNWRDALCRCGKCLDYYKSKNIGFLLDKEDSIAEYEKMAKQKREEKLQQQEGAELSLLDKLGHVGKMEFLNGIADMADEIRSFLVSPLFLCNIALVH